MFLNFKHLLEICSLIRWLLLADHQKKSRLLQLWVHDVNFLLLNLLWFWRLVVRGLDLLLNFFQLDLLGRFSLSLWCLLLLWRRLFSFFLFFLLWRWRFSTIQLRPAGSGLCLCWLKLYLYLVLFWVWERTFPLWKFSLKLELPFGKTSKEKTPLFAKDNSHER